MKKAILLSVAVFVCVKLFSQHRITPLPKFKTVCTPEHQIQQNVLPGQPSHSSISLKPTPPEKNADFVNIVNLGTSGNAYWFMQKGSYLWADDNLKTVTNFHQFGGSLQGSFKQYGYDISTDAGLNWTNQILCFTENLNMPARHTHHGIYNPPENLDPAEAYVSYFGKKAMEVPYYYHGRAKIGDQSDTTDNWISQVPADSLFFYDPSGFVITQTGEIWVSDFSMSWESGTMEYFNKIIVSHGIWNEAIEDFEFELFSLDFPILYDFRPADSKVAFSPNGQVAWIAVLSDDGSVPISANRSFYPILWKTTDSGQTWEGPISVALAGENGIDKVKDFLSDAELEELYGYIPDRNTIEFTTAYDFDLHVDTFGKPHIAVVVGITGEDPYSIVTGMSETTGYMFAAPFDITVEYYPTEEWFGYELGRLKTFRGTFGDITSGNRIQIASSWDGLYMMITWGDTDLPGVEDNQQPDIWFRGVDVVTHWLTGNGNGEDKPINVTEFSEGMWQSYFHNLSHYAFKIEDTDRLFTVPLTYLQMNPEDPGEPVQHKYITDFVANFEIWGVPDASLKMESIAVSECMPNPAQKSFEITINVFETVNLDLMVCNLAGQKVFELPNQSFPPGDHPINIDVSSFEPGVYIISISSEGIKVSRKLIVK